MVSRTDRKSLIRESGLVNMILKKMRKMLLQFSNDHKDESNCSNSTFLLPQNDLDEYEAAHVKP